MLSSRSPMSSRRQTSTSKVTEGDYSPRNPGYDRGHDSGRDVDSSRADCFLDCGAGSLPSDVDGCGTGNPAGNLPCGPADTGEDSPPDCVLDDGPRTLRDCFRDCLPNDVRHTGVRNAVNGVRDRLGDGGVIRGQE